jgi:hypothetical protein
MPAIQMDAQTGRANVTKEEIKAFNAYPDEQDKLFFNLCRPVIIIIIFAS